MEERAEIIIVGAGPVGLLLGNLLAASRIPVLILEKRLHPKTGSKAIGITPVSLAILAKIDLAKKFIALGVRVQEVYIYGSGYKLGQVRLDDLPPPYPYILSLPQDQTERLLEENLKKYPQACLKRGREVYKIEESLREGRVWARVYAEPDAHTAGQEEIYTAQIVCGCDGLYSTIRTLLHIPFKGRDYSVAFLMGDYRDESELGEAACLFFTRQGSVESFPLPEAERRWIIQTPCLVNRGQAEYLEQKVAQRTGIRLSPELRLSASAFRPQRYLAAAFFKNRFVLCGDSAHTMSPIGGQGMNTGFADADWLAFSLSRFILENKPGRITELLGSYEKIRKKAVRITANRTWVSMRIGTFRGRLASGVRNAMICALLHLPLAKRLPRLYTGHSIPYKYPKSRFP